MVAAALEYPTIKRVLAWGSFVTAKAEPNDLDYSLVVSVYHSRTRIQPQHHRFLLPHFARQRYGVDAGYLAIRDYPLEGYLERMEFLCQRDGSPCGIVEICLRGEQGEVT